MFGSVLTLCRPRLVLVCILPIVLALALTSKQGFADDDDEDAPRVLAAETRISPVLRLTPGQSVDNLFLSMVRRAGPADGCGIAQGPPLIAEPLVAPGAWACSRIRNDGALAGVWRIDFEGTFGAGYLFLAQDSGAPRVVLSHPGFDASERRVTITADRRLASRPIVLAPGGWVDLFVRIDTPADVLDADPLLRPEETFDTVRLKRSFNFGFWIGASVLLCTYFAYFARLLQSPSAARYAFYFTATALAAASNEGAFNGLLAGNPTFAIAALDKGLEALQIGAHVAFMAAFVEDSLPGHPMVRWLRRAAPGAVLGLIGAALASLALGGVEGAIQYHDMGFEIDPLIEDPFASIPLLIGALVVAGWYLTVLFTAGVLWAARTDGSRLFTLGAVALVLGMVGVSVAGEVFETFGDDELIGQYVLLFDALIFAAAIVRQTYGLRHQRDIAVQQELRTAREKLHLAEDLLEARGDRDRARDLAEAHRARLALTGHDLRQPLTSLRLALTEAEATSPALGHSLRASLDFLNSVLDATVTETRPDADPDHPARPETEDVPVAMLFQNAVRMFGEEARAKGLSLTFEPTDHVVRTRPVPLIRTVSNLVSNAVKYTETGTVTLRARQAADGSVTLEVHDTGPGMTEAEADRLRQSYIRGQDDGPVAGDGLGLSSVDTLSRDLGLTLNITSTPGQGSCFALEGLNPVA